MVLFCTSMYNLSMKTVSFTDFRNNASSFLDLVEQGEEVEIQRHGKAVARLVPPILRKEEPTWRKPGLKLVTKAPSLSKAVLQDRR
jgi:prevent-host-death family protein